MERTAQKPERPSRLRRKAGPNAKETEAFGVGAKESERLDTTDEAGEPTHGTRLRKEGRRIMEPREGKKVSTRCWKPSQRNKRG
jgi:hypothetical protein